MIIKFTLYSAPSPPSIVTENVTATSTMVSLSWFQLKDDFIKGFNLTLSYTGPCTKLYSNTTKLHPFERNVTLSRLQEYSRYSIVISAFNDVGSNLSQVINFITESSG